MTRSTTWAISDAHYLDVKRPRLATDSISPVLEMKVSIHSELWSERFPGNRAASFRSQRVLEQQPVE